MLSAETARDGLVAWYRNPTGGQRSLCIPYETGNEHGKMCPDFVSLHTDLAKAHCAPASSTRMSITFADAGDKLRGLGAHAAKHVGGFARSVSVIRAAGSECRLLDLKDATIRAALTSVSGADDIEKLFARDGAAYS